MKLKLTDIPVVYTNHDDQPERKELLEKNLKDLGFKNIIRVSGFKDPIGKRGCAYSHAVALEEIDPPFILLEDDCLPLNFVDDIITPHDGPQEVKKYEESSEFFTTTNYIALNNNLK